MKNLTRIVFFIVAIIAGKIYPQTSEDYNKFRMANSFVQAGEVEKGLALIEELLKKYPDNFQFFDAAQKAYVQIKQYDKAIELIESFIKKYPQNITLYGNLGGIYYLKGEYDKAYRIWDEGIQKVPRNHSVYRMMANFAIERRAFSKAIEYLQMAKKESGNIQLYAFEIANLYSILMMYDEATREYCELLLANPELIYSVQGSIAQYLNRQENIESAIKIAQYYDKKYDKIEFKLLLSFLYETMKDYDNALLLLVELDKKRQRNGEDLFRFAENRLRDKNYSIAAKAYQFAEANANNQIIIQRAKIGAAKTFYFSLKEEENEDFDFIKLSELDSSKLSQFEIALQRFQRVIQDYPRTEFAAEALYYSGEIQFLSRNFAEAEKLFRDLINNYSFSYFSRKSRIYLAETLIMSNKLDAAKIELENFLKLGFYDENEKARAKYLFAKIYLWTYDFENSKEIFKELTSSANNDFSNDAIEQTFLLSLMKLDSLTTIDFLQADFLFFTCDYDRALKIYFNIINKTRFPYFKYRSQILIAKCYIAKNNFIEAKTYLEEIISKEKENVYLDEAYYLLGLLYANKLDEKNKAAQYFKSILVNYPNSLYLQKARQKLSTIL